MAASKWPRPTSASPIVDRHKPTCGSKRDFGGASGSVKLGRIWIGRQTVVGDLNRFVRAMRYAEIDTLGIVAAGVIRRERNGPVSLTDDLSLEVGPVGTPTVQIVDHISHCIARQRVGIMRIDHERLFEQGTRRIVARPLLWHGLFLNPCHTMAHPRMVRSTASGFAERALFSGLGPDELNTESVAQPRDHLILQLEEVGDVVLEALRPKVRA
jgi:hypothetical protein